MKKIEKTGKTLEEATRAALEELNVTQDQVEIVVLEHGAKGFLGLGSKPVKISVTVKFDPVMIAKAFLEEIAATLNVEILIQPELKDKQLNINLTGEQVGILIGKHGQTLDALQYLIGLVVNKGDAPYVSINLDAENYRKKRKETLETLALNLAKKVKMTKKSVYLEPMSSYERRIIHAALQGDRSICTYSEGDEPNRYIVISLKDQKSSRDHRTSSEGKSGAESRYNKDWKKDRQ